MAEPPRSDVFVKLRVHNRLVLGGEAVGRPRLDLQLFLWRKWYAQPILLWLPSAAFAVVKEATVPCDQPSKPLGLGFWQLAVYHHFGERGGCLCGDLNPFRKRVWVNRFILAIQPFGQVLRACRSVRGRLPPRNTFLICDDRWRAPISLLDPWF